MSVNMGIDHRLPVTIERMVCTKKAFRTQAHALKEAAFVINQPWFNGESVRAYPCPHCRQWHLSTTPRGGKETWVKKRKRNGYDK